MKLFASKEF